ncbi:organic solute transporter subunit alpha [Hyalella azteca]|uniref:Organic solute transporter subunit alpha n=1 Tax=Hyalella azteca TaxID=294128 RepID=A0A8B7PDD1_HYAAZ|nr:organic solute transporter subunit alpha [Hyalella azteca]
MNMAGDTSSSFIPHYTYNPVMETTELMINATHVVRAAVLDPMMARECTKEVRNFQPSNAQFIEILGPAGYVMMAMAGIGLLILIAVFIDTVLRMQKVVRREHKSCVTFVLSVYPVLGLCTFLGILFPKADSVMDVSSQLWFALCMLQFFKLTLVYFGGETKFVQSLEGKVLPWRGPPCCCWPCCWPFCPKRPVNKRQIRFIKLLLYQHPIVQSMMTIIGISLWKEGLYSFGDFSPYKGHVYVFTITTTSFLLALWAFIVMFKASIPELRRYHYGRKILVFQLCLVFLRFQALIFGVILLPAGAIPCVPPISPKVYANTILCCLLMGQLVILSVLARFIYLQPMPDIDSDQKVPQSLEDQKLRLAETENGNIASNDTEEFLAVQQLSQETA